MDDPLGDLLALPGVFESVDAARGAVDALLRDTRGPQLRRRLPELAAMSLQRAARASALLELADPTLSLDPFEPPFGDDRAGRTAEGALRVCTALSELARVWPVAPSQALARLHALAAGQLAGPDELGRPRPEAGVASRLSAVAELATAGTRAPAVIVAAVVHAEILDLAPFGTCDGVVARAAARLVLISRGLDPVAVTIPEEGHLQLTGQYTAALHAYRSGEPTGLATWITHCAAALALGAQAARAVAATIAGGPQPG